MQSGPHHKILIVDDDPLICTVLEQFLLKNNYDLAFAGSGEEALEIIAKSAPDLVIMDIMLPGLDGYATVRAMRSNPKTAELPVIFLSARDEASDVISGLELGAADFVSKPFNPKELLLRIGGRLQTSESKRRQTALLEDYKSEIQRVSQIQQSFMPARLCSSQGLQLFGRTFPAKWISGDYFDFITHRFGVSACIGDVSGKGMSANMIVLMARLFMREWTYDVRDTKEALLQLNGVLLRNTPPYVFMSFILLSWDEHASRLIFTGAGHENMLIYRAESDTVENISVGGVVLGLRGNISGNLRERSISLGKEDAVLLYTDGVTEALGPNGEQFQVKRLTEALQKHAAKDPESGVNAIYDELKQYAANVSFEDDVTLVLLKRG